VTETVVRGWIRRGLVQGERVVAESGKPAWHLTVSDADLARLAAAPSRHPLRKAPLPDQLPDGRWSAPGIARRFGVHKSTVRGWIARSVLTAEYEAHGAYPRVAWVRLDEATTRRLEELALALHSRG
jgi:hypothetical protein